MLPSAVDEGVELPCRLGTTQFGQYGKGVLQQQTCRWPVAWRSGRCEQLWCSSEPAMDRGQRPAVIGDKDLQPGRRRARADPGEHVLGQSWSIARLIAAALVVDHRCQCGREFGCAWRNCWRHRWLGIGAWWLLTDDSRAHLVFAPREPYRDVVGQRLEVAGDRVVDDPEQRAFLLGTHAPVGTE